MGSNRTSRVGEIVLLDFAGKNGAQSESGQAVIISDVSGLLAAPITDDVDEQVHLKYAMTFEQNDLASGTIEKAGVVKIDKINSISEKYILGDEVATFKPAKIEKMLRIWSQLVSETFYTSVHLSAKQELFVPGKSHIPYGGRVYDEREISALVDSSLDFWLTSGRYARQFEKEFAQFCNVKHASLVNSGSSANLLALTALTSPKLGDRCLLPGDEVITVASGFPTTVNPIFQNQLVPVFIDVEIPTYNIDASFLEQALSDRTRAVMLAHTLGNPFNIEAVTEFCKRHDLWLVEDCCDALGSRYNGRLVGTFGDVAAYSFYPAHHITMGEGGCVVTNNSELDSIVKSFRDWGRDCSCEPGQDNRCGKRFAQQCGDLPYGYDHKYVYSHIGYNLKVTDMQAAIGVTQLEKLPEFIEARKNNFKSIRDGLKDLEEFLILPEATKNSEPSWFGFPIAIKASVPFTRNELTASLESKKIATRLLFGGNIIRQPAYTGLNYRVIGALENSDFVMNNIFWIGVYPGLTREMIDFMVSSIRELCFE